MNIFLDMDGTIVDWNKGMCKAHKVPLRYEWLSPGSLGITAARFWKPCNHEKFWRELEWMPDGLEILSIAEKAGTVYLVTSPTLSSQSYSGKILWVERNLPEYKRRAILCPPKELLAGNGILVDDVDKNVDHFRVKGTAILVPRPWNSRATCENFNLEAEINEYLSRL